MNIWLLRLPLILSSGSFFPVSCRPGSAVSLPLIQFMDSCDIVAGDTPHSDFFVLAEADEQQTHPTVVSLKEVDDFRVAHPLASFLLRQNEGAFSANTHSSEGYQLFALQNGIIFGFIVYLAGKLPGRGFRHRQVVN